MSSPVPRPAPLLGRVFGGTADEVARGVALGAWFGLLPKDNATAWAVAAATLLVRLNLAAAAAAAGLVAVLAPLLDPVLHALGHALLTADAVRGPLAPLLRLPGAAWLGWDNSVTLAAALVGAAAFRPLAGSVRSALRRRPPRRPLTPFWLPRVAVAAGVGLALMTGRGPAVCGVAVSLGPGAAGWTLPGGALPDPDRPGRPLIAFDRLTADLDAAALLRGKVRAVSGTLTGLRFGPSEDDRGPDELLSAADLLPVCDGLLDARDATGGLPSAFAATDPAAAGQLETVRLARRLIRDRAGRLESPVSRVAHTATDAADRSALAAAAARDAERLRAAADGPRLDADAADRALLGPALSRRLTLTLAVARRLRDGLDGAGDRLAPPPPRRGVRVPLPAAASHPAVLLDGLLVSGTLPLPGGPAPFVGTLSGLTTTPARLGRPLVGSFTSVGGDEAEGTAPRFLVRVTHDAAGAEPATAVEVRVVEPLPADAALHLGGTALPVTADADGRPPRLEWSAALRLTGRGPDAAVAGTLDLRLLGRLEDGEVLGETIADRLVRSAAAAVPDLRGTLHVDGPAARPSWRLTGPAGGRFVAELRRRAEPVLARRAEQLIAAAGVVEGRFLADLASRRPAAARILTAGSEAPADGRIERTAARALLDEGF